MLFRIILILQEEPLSSYQLKLMTHLYISCPGTGGREGEGGRGRGRGEGKERLQHCWIFVHKYKLLTNSQSGISRETRTFLHDCVDVG